MQRPIKIKYRSNLMGVEDFHFWEGRRLKLDAFFFILFYVFCNGLYFLL